MKHTKKFIAILMAISILLCSVIAITSSAADSSQGDNEAETEELQPMVARNCPVIYYRYGNSYTQRDIDVQYLKSGYLSMNHGISVNTNSNITSLIDLFGTPQAVTYIPSGLHIVHTSGTHYEIAPSRSNMTWDEYVDLCNQIY